MLFLYLKIKNLFKITAFFIVFQKLKKILLIYGEFVFEFMISFFSKVFNFIQNEILKNRKQSILNLPLCMPFVGYYIFRFVLLNNNKIIALKLYFIKMFEIFFEFLKIKAKDSNLNSLIVNEINFDNFQFFLYICLIVYILLYIKHFFANILILIKKDSFIFLFLQGFYMWRFWILISSLIICEHLNLFYTFSIQHANQENYLKLLHKDLEQLKIAFLEEQENNKKSPKTTLYQFLFMFICFGIVLDESFILFRDFRYWPFMKSFAQQEWDAMFKWWIRPPARVTNYSDYL